MNKQTRWEFCGRKHESKYVAHGVFLRGLNAEFWAQVLLSDDPLFNCMILICGSGRLTVVSIIRQNWRRTRDERLLTTTNQNANVCLLNGSLVGGWISGCEWESSKVEWRTVTSSKGQQVHLILSQGAANKQWHDFNSGLITSRNDRQTIYVLTVNHSTDSRNVMSGSSDRPVTSELNQLVHI